MALPRSSDSLELRLCAQAGQQKIPLSASLELLPLCNANCKMCYDRLFPRQTAACARGILCRSRRAASTHRWANGGAGCRKGRPSAAPSHARCCARRPSCCWTKPPGSLDVTTERTVLRNIVQRHSNKTCIVTTHRPSVLNLCQRIYRVMDTRVTALSEEESSRMAMDF